MNRVYDLVIIGAGPGGISAAIEAKIAGVEKILILEKAEAHNETIRKFYKRGKRVDADWQGIKAEFHGNVSFEEGSKESYLEQFDDLIAKYDLQIVYNHHVYAIEKKEDGIFEIGADHELGVIKAKKVIVAIGIMGKPNKPSYKFPPKIRPRLNFNLDKVQTKEKVLIVGGGDTAGEYAYGLKDMEDLDCQVALNYRRAEITRMSPLNKEITERYISEGKINSKLGVDIENVEVSENEKVLVNFKDGTKEEFDRVVFALGGSTPKDFLANCGINFDDEKWIPIYNKETFETNVKDLYIIGDVIKSASISVAINHAYAAIKDITK